MNEMSGDLLNEQGKYKDFEADIMVYFLYNDFRLLYLLLNIQDAE